VTKLTDDRAQCIAGWREPILGSLPTLAFATFDDPMMFKVAQSGGENSREISGIPRWMSLKVRISAISSRRMRGTQRTATISDVFAIGQD
jgi:hypothetical protein